jgi:hypothetical protein
MRSSSIDSIAGDILSSMSCVGNSLCGVLYVGRKLHFNYLVVA